MQLEYIFNYPVLVTSSDECVADIFRRIKAVTKAGVEKPFWLACFNPNAYVQSLKDDMFSRALKAADWLVPDGTGVVLASRLFGGAIKNRVSGSDVFTGLHKMLNDVGGMSVFFLGVTEGTLMLIRQRMALDYPHIKIAGTFAPPFKDEFSDTDNRMMIEAINKARPDVLWVGISAPKQEKWIYLNKDKLNVKFIAAIGAAFDFFAGTVKRAPVLIQKIGMEWLYRSVLDPRRIGLRNLKAKPKFIVDVLKYKMCLLK